MRTSYLVADAFVVRADSCAAKILPYGWAMQVGMALPVFASFGGGFVEGRSGE